MHRVHYVSIDECAGVHDTAVVIDVLRAFSTAAWAFELGAERIILSDDIDEALAIKASLPGSLALKDAEPVQGFELSNSPVELRAFGDITGRAIVQKTTAGTVGAVAARHAERLYCASFLVAAATASAIRRSDAHDVYFVVTGEGGAGDEDRACAEYIAALIDDPHAGPEPYLQRVDASNAARIMRQRVAEGVPGVDAGDILACMEVNRFDFVMRARDEGGLLVLRAYNRGDA